MRKYKDKASDLIEKGKYEKALSIYRDILQAFPNDTAIMLKIGDLCKKMNLIPEAVAVYSAAAEYHAQSGRLLQAIAVCRLILEVDGSHRATQQKLASLYAQKYGSSELSGITDLNEAVEAPTGAESIRLTEADLKPRPRVSTSAAPSVSSPASQFDDTTENPLAGNSDETAKVQVFELDEYAASNAETSGTDGLRLDFTPVFENDEEPSAVYEQEDLDEYLAELKAAGLTSELEAEQEALNAGPRPATERNLILQISRPAPPPQTLPPMPLFSSLDEGALIDLINELPMRHFEALETIVSDGDHGDSFFIIISGSVEVFKNGESLATLEEGAFFGEMAMLFPGPRQATVVTVEPCDLFEISNEQLNRLRMNHPRVGRVLLEFAEDRLLNNLLNTSPIFAPFDDVERQSLMDKFEPYLIDPGTVVIQEGEQSSGLYLIVIGEVSVTMTGDNGEPTEIERLKGNEIFGEVSLLSHSGAISTVTTATQTRVLMLPRARFSELIMTHPQVLELVAAISDERIATMKAIKEGLSNQ
ncbi:MAG: cyclic nucleotide-binding domain-containing protein [Deltaproteobacteria bacterium]|nr:cyclic nucleotide-binding domain-containing protein [Deltaproteobacteria bacterium]